MAVAWPGTGVGVELVAVVVFAVAAEAVAAAEVELVAVAWQSGIVGPGQHSVLVGWAESGAESGAVVVELELGL